MMTTSEEKSLQYHEVSHMILKRILDEMRQHNYDNNKQIAGVLANLHIIQERLRRIESVAGKTGFGYHNRQVSRMSSTRSSQLEEHPSVDNSALNGSEGVHRLILQEKINTLVKDLDLKTTELLDDLIADGCLTEDEASNIRGNSSRKNQIRKLVYVLSRRSKAKFIKFIENLQRSHNYPHIARELSDCFQSKLSKGVQNTDCIVCVIKRDVDLEDVVESLCENSIVDLEFVNMIASCDNAPFCDQDNLWEAVFWRINQSNDRRLYIQKLKEALSFKYEHIAAKLNVSFMKQLACCCQDTEQCSMFGNKYPMSFAGSCDSISDLSTTSSFKRKPPGSVELQSLTVSSTTDPLPRTLAWVDSIESGSPYVSDNDNNSVASSFIRDSLNQVTEVTEVNETSVNSPDTVEPDNANFRKGIENRTEAMELDTQSSHSIPESNKSDEKLSSAASTSDFTSTSDSSPLFDTGKQTVTELFKDKSISNSQTEEISPENKGEPFSQSNQSIPRIIKKKRRKKKKDKVENKSDENGEMLTKTVHFEDNKPETHSPSASFSSETPSATESSPFLNTSQQIADELLKEKGSRNNEHLDAGAQIDDLSIQMNDNLFTKPTQTGGSIDKKKKKRKKRKNKAENNIAALESDQSCGVIELGTSNVDDLQDRMQSDLTNEKTVHVDENKNINVEAFVSETDIEKSDPLTTSSLQCEKMDLENYNNVDLDMKKTDQLVQDV